MSKSSSRSDVTFQPNPMPRSPPPRVPAPLPYAPAIPRTGIRASPRPSGPPPVAAPTTKTNSKLRPLIITLGVAAVTALGTWYGAGLKMEKQATEERERIAGMGVEERVAGLEAARKGLVAQKTELERKIGEVRERRRTAEVQRVDGGGGGKSG